MSNLSIVASSHKKSRASGVGSQLDARKEDSINNRANASDDKVPLIIESSALVIREETDPSVLDNTQPLESTQPLEQKPQDETNNNVTQDDQA